MEERLKQATQPTTAVCTSTLELGIDIGEIDTISQIDAPSSVASLRQRLGRSGRRKDKPAVLRLYVNERYVDANSHPLDCLRMGLVHAVAVVALLLEGWCEPPDEQAVDLSTLTHQLLAIIAEKGGVRADEAYRLLCEQGAFARIPSWLWSPFAHEALRHHHPFELGLGK